MEKENVNHHKIYNIYAKNNVFFYVSRETQMCIRDRDKDTDAGRSNETNVKQTSAEIPEEQNNDKGGEK